MAANGNFRIASSVGKGGVNQKNDVLVVQDLLNYFVEPPIEFLAVDGLCGPKTKAAIVWYQRTMVGYKNPDGRVDPDGETLRTLVDLKEFSNNNPQPNPDDKWNERTAAPPKNTPASEVPPELNRYKKEMMVVFEQEGLPYKWTAFWDEVIAGHVPQIRSTISRIGRANDATRFAQAVVQMYKWGLSTGDVGVVLRQVFTLTKGNPFALLGSMAQAGSAIGQLLGSIAKVGLRVVWLLDAIEILYLLSEQKIGRALTKSWALFLRIGCAWAMMVEALQKFAQAHLPASWTTTRFFKILRALDPIGLSEAGMDALVTLVETAIRLGVTEEADWARLMRLAERLEQGATAVFAQGGHDAVTLVRELVAMDTRDFENLLRQFSHDTAGLLKAIAGWSKQAVSDYGDFRRENDMLYD